MKTEKKRNLEKLKRKKMNLEKNKMEFGKNLNGFHRALHIYIYIYIIVSFFVAFMYLCKPIASAQNPPVIKKERNGLHKVHGIVRTLLASILVSIVIFFLM